MVKELYLDHTLKIYLLLLIVSVYDFALFACWGVYVRIKERRKMSSVYWAITALFAAMSIVSSFNLYARHIRLNDTDRYFDLLSTNWWALRHVPLFLVLTGIGYFMSKRLFLSYTDDL